MENPSEFPSTRSHSPTFEIEVVGGGGIEMAAAPTAASYTSLRDIMPHPNNDSWNEIPIKNHLLKQAAIAYLQPMSTPPPEVGNKGFLQTLKENCGCFRWLHGGVFSTLGKFVGLFCERRRLNNEGRRREEEDDGENVD